MSTTLGVQRESLLNNPLLQKSELGKPLKRCFTLPPDGFTYGRPNRVVDNGTAEALSSWNVIKPKVVTKTKEERDFIKLNRQAIQAGLTSAPEHYQFRATHDVKVVNSAKDRSLNKMKKKPHDMVFGEPTCPSTPVFDLLEHKYQDQWLQEREKAEESMRAKQEEKKLVKRKTYETRALMLRQHQPPVDNSPLWQMKKFQKVPANVDSFRTDKDKQTAFKNHDLDSTARTGFIGHGVYETGRS